MENEEAEQACGVAEGREQDGEPTAEGLMGGISPEMASHRKRTGWKRVRWNKRIRANFLDHLSATCNVRDSAQAAGVPPESAYALRRRDPAFAEAWTLAVQLGRETMEMLLIGHVLERGDGRVITSGVTDRVAPVDIDTALRLLAAHREGREWKGGPKRRAATREETDAAIMKKLTAVRARIERERSA